VKLNLFNIGILTLLLFATRLCGLLMCTEPCGCGSCTDGHWISPAVFYEESKGDVAVSGIAPRTS
jgi:hypothetical protein